METHEKALLFLKELRQANPIFEDIYLYGSCLNLYHVLKIVFPSAVCYYGQVPGHVITKIDDKFYDITGEIIDVSEYCPINDIWADKYKTEDQLKYGEMYVTSQKDEYVRKRNCNK